ncbi:MAG: L,D-transpeptidase [Mariprofundales bacterium]
MIDISIQNQLLTHHWRGVRHCYPVSTALRGAGNLRNSEQTPIGRHRIAGKIGAGAVKMTAFRGRQPVGLYQPGIDDPKKDWILSRILWLTGEETGINRRGCVDTFSRYIYIHGTADECRLGTPVSRGCIRMANDDIITLFDRIREHERVVIRAH